MSSLEGEFARASPTPAAAACLRSPLFLSWAPNGRIQFGANWPYLTLLVITDAGVFGVTTFGASYGVEVETSDGGFGVGGHLNLHHGGEVVAVGKLAVGEQHVAVAGEIQCGRLGSIAGGDDHGLSSRGCRGELIVHEGDLHLAIGGDEKLRVRFDDGEKAAAVGAGDFLLVCTD